MIARTYLNNEWLFNEKFEESMIDGSYKGEYEEVRVPHSVVTTPFNYFDESVYQMVSGYSRVFTADDSWKGKKVILTFDAVAHEASVYVNGRLLGTHSCGYTAFSYDISDVIRYGEENRITVRVDSRESLNVPPFGHVIDYMTYGGIYRDVYIDVKNPVYIEDIYVHSDITFDPSGKTYATKLISDITLNEEAAAGYELEQTLRDINTGKEITWNSEVNKPDTDKSDISTSLIKELTDIILWHVDNPYMYELTTMLIFEGDVVDTVITRTAFRKSEFRTDGYYLNNKKFKFRGLNRHQSYPYVGYAMPKSMQVMDADILKYELKLSAVRTSHYPQSHYFLDRCDEIGLLVFTEFPGWQHIGDEEWKKQACLNEREMILQYRNHPSIMLWGIRINESVDDDEFYTRTNAIAHELDPYRPTGGVRCNTKMNLLEDVYTFNDFVHEGNNEGCRPKKAVTPDMNKPYFVTEYNGHMYPTKSFDWEEHRREHLLRHANVLDAIMSYPDICGSFGWCMADYNTHKDFGSGDRICYHGVLDMFRNPKMAAGIYTMQQDKDIYLDLTSSMDIGEHPGCIAGKTYILSNADSVKMYKNDRFVKEYKMSDSDYKNLYKGPVFIDDVLGDSLDDIGDYSKKCIRDLKTMFNEAAFFGLSGLSRKGKLAGMRLLSVHHMTEKEITAIYTRYVNNWGGESTVYRFEAIKDGKVVKTLIKEPVKEIHLEASVDHTDLTDGDTYDVAAVRLQMVDQNGNLVPYYQEPVFIKTVGAIEIIGDDYLSLKGGMGAVYVKTTGESVHIKVTADSNRQITIYAE